MSDQRDPLPLYTRLQRHSASKGSLVIAFLWGLAEATLFFVVPDVYLGFMALFHWRNGLLATVATVAGAMVGGTVMYALAAANATATNQLLVRIPLISPQMVDYVAQQMRVVGQVSMVSAPLEGIPYKIFAAQAGQQQLPLISFLLVTILARLERILPVALLAAALGTGLKRFVQRRTALVASIYVLLWVAAYVMYYLRMR